MTDDWTDMIVGARMELDGEFEHQVAESEFSNQQWGLIMTAVEFEIENPDDPEAARIVADTSKLPSIVPELDKIDQRMGMAAGGGAGSTGRSGGSGSGGLFGSIKGLLGFGGDGGDEQLAAAEALAREYAEELQTKLEDRGRWDAIREAARP